MPRGTGFPLAKVSAIFRVLLVGPAVLPQKMNFSNHMLRKAVCSLTDTEPVFMISVTYPLQPPMVLVFILKEAWSKKLKDRSEAVIFRPVNIMTSSKVGVLRPWPNKKALMALD